MNETIAGLMNVPGVRLAAIVGREGDVQAVSHQDPTTEVLAGLASAIFAAVAGALAKGGITPLESCLFEAGKTSVQLHGAGDQILVAVCASDANVGRIKLALRRAAERNPA